ncbi:hypothetical protein KL921_002510 [Ogataea angusta]|nr:hypothetical protein KL921_002510 [Ogataea angusta]KAG7862342.1 hypothetical protein KL919_001472 [Ogataea angusta]
MESLVADILEEYGDLHRSVLQFLMAAKSIEFEVLYTVFVKLVIKSLIEKHHPEPSNSDQERYLRELLGQARPELPTLTSESLVKTIALINRELAALDFEIVETLAQDDEKNIIASFVNTKSSPSIKLSTSYTEKEIGVINQLIDQMFENPFDDEDNLTYSLSYAQALNIAKRNIQTITDAQKFINKLESSGWLETRTQMERYHCVMAVRSSQQWDIGALGHNAMSVFTNTVATCIRNRIEPKPALLTTVNLRLKT